MFGGLALRFLQYVLVLWVALTLNFALPRLAPGDPLRYLFGQEVDILSPEQRRQVLHQYGLDRSLIEQYRRYLVGVLRGDLGRSIRTGKPVTEVLLDRLPWTLLVVGPSVLISATLGAALGALAAWHRGRPLDVGLLTAMLVVDAMPGFWIAMLLIAVVAVQLGWLPSFGAVALTPASGRFEYVVEVGRRLILPVTTVVFATIGQYFLLARASMLTTLSEDYMQMAAAKGLRERRLIFHHALPNALLPVYTSVTLSLGVLLSGAVVVETVFGYPGLGRLTYEAVLARDYPLLQGAFLLVALGVTGANLLADLTYPLLDPRVRRADVKE